MTDKIAGTPMCPLLTAAAGKVRPCAREGCEWWVESFDARYSTCAVLALASSSGKTLGVAKRVVRWIAQGGGTEMTAIERCERALARLAWRLYHDAADSCGEEEAREMVGEITRELMERYPEEVES